MSDSSMRLRGGDLVVVPISSGASVTERNAAIPDERESGFRAVSGGPEIASGAVLLVEAYAAIWAIALAFILLGWRRMVRLESRLANLERVLGNKDSVGS